MMLKVRPLKVHAEAETTLLLAREKARLKRIAEASEREKKTVQKQAEKERKLIEKQALKEAKAAAKKAEQSRKAVAKSASQATAGQKRKRKNTQLEEQITADQNCLIILD